MSIQKISREELNQAEGFLEYAEETGIITKKQKEKIGNVLGLDKFEKKGFFGWLSKSFGKKLEDMGEIKKVLKKKHIDFEKIWEEYTKYLEVKDLFEKYKTPYDELNDKIVNFLTSNYSNDLIEKAKIFMSSNIYKEGYIGGNIREIGFFWYFLENTQNTNDLDLYLNNLTIDALFDIYCSNLCYIEGDSFNKKLSTNIKYLKQHGYNTYKFGSKELLRDDIIECVNFFEKCDFIGFWNDFEQSDETDEKLKETLLEFKDFDKNKLLKYCLNKRLSFFFDKIIVKRPSTYLESHDSFAIKSVHMFGCDGRNYKLMNNELQSHDGLIYLRSVYWTTNWKKNIDLLYKKGLIESDKIVDKCDVVPGSDEDKNNKEIACLKMLDHDILKSLVRDHTTKDSYEKFSDDVFFGSDNVNQNLKLILGRYKIDMDSLVNLEGWSDIVSNAKKDNLELLFGKYDTNELSFEKISMGTSLFINADTKNLKTIFDNYNIRYDELLDLENTLCNTITKNLQLIIGHYKNIKKDLTYKQLEDLSKSLLYANPKNLEIILENFDDIEDIKELSDIIRNANTENLRFILKNFNNIDDIKELSNIIRDAKPENLKFIFEKYKNQGLTPINLKELDNIVCLAITNKLKIVLESFRPINLVEITQYEKLFRFNGEWPTSLNFKEENHKGYINFLNEIVDTNYDSDKKSNMIEFLVTLTFEEAKNYLKTFQKLDNSISPDIQLIKNELINEILKSKNPLILADTIVGIFEKNNIPLTGQIFKVFELLYPQNRIQELFEKYPYSSPKLKSLLDDGKDMYKLIYKDLMNISIKSGDRTLRDYLMVFVGSEELLRKFEVIISSDGFNGNDENCLADRLEEGEQEKLLYLFRKISVLCGRYLGKQLIELEKIEHGKYGKYTITDDKLVSLYYEIKKGFNLRGGKSIYDRLQSLLYVNGLKYHSVQEVLNEMNKSKRHAHERGLKLYNEATGGKIKFPDEAFVKGVSDLSFKKIIGTGIRSREYLGSGYNLLSTGVCGAGRGNSATSDTTPFDIDGFCSDYFVQADYGGGIAGDGKQDTIGYGYVNFVVDITKADENGNQKFYDNTPNNNADNKFRRNTIRKKEYNGSDRYNDNQYELFQTLTSEGMEHCGIRTGIPMTEVDYIIYTGKFESKGYQDMCYEIARNGYYIPVTDRDGMIKFTPEMYHRIRAGFNFMQYYDGFDVEQVDGKWVSAESDNKVNKRYTGTNERINEQSDRLKKLIAENSPSNEKYSKFAKENNELAKNTIDQIIKILEDNFKITFKSQFDTSITGAEIYDSGSTGRGTDIPTKDVDLDFTLILDEKDYEKIDEIKRVIHEEIGTQRIKDHEVNKLLKEKNERIELGNQLKSEINNIGKSESRPNGVPLDLLILKKSQVINYSSSDAMKEKLSFIEKNSGKEDYDWVRTNIIIMKKLLKAKGCYKHPEGGIAGIGVENWITQHHGSFIEALESFEQIAYEGEYEPGKQPIPLEEFKKRYPMYDAGENYKDGGNDNFVNQINEKKNPMAYESILQIIQALRTKGIKGIEELIKEYEEKKKEHIS